MNTLYTGRVNKPKLILLVLCLLLLIGAIYFISLENLSSSDSGVQEIEPQKFSISKPFSLLILGTDSVVPGHLEGWNGRSDLILVIHINPYTKRVSIISVPRDTYINFTDFDIHRINHANQKGGYQLSKKVVKRFLGIEIDHVVVLSIKSVIELIDSIGPIKVFVPQRMTYHDNSANLHIDINPGLQILNGKQLMNFLRYRNAVNGDIGRIQRQQIFFRALLRKITEPKLIFKAPGILLKANKSFLTDMSFQEMFELGILLRSLVPRKGMSPEWKFKTYIVPGDFASDGYWLPDQSKLQIMMQEIKEHEHT